MLEKGQPFAGTVSKQLGNDRQFIKLKPNLCMAYRGTGLLFAVFINSS